MVAHGHYWGGLGKTGTLKPNPNRRMLGHVDRSESWLCFIDTFGDEWAIPRNHQKAWEAEPQAPRATAGAQHVDDRIEGSSADSVADPTDVEENPAGFGLQSPTLSTTADVARSPVERPVSP